jgi:hypothetical protein
MAVKQTITHGSSEAFYDEGSHSRRTAATPQRPLKRDEYSAVAGTHTHPVVFETDREALCTDAYAPAPSSFKRKLEEKSETVVPLVSLDSGNIPGVTIYNCDCNQEIKSYFPTQPTQSLMSQATPKRSQATPKRSREMKVYDCIDIFTAPKEYNESDNWYCGSCNQVAPGKRTCKLRVLPDVLIIHLKRFTSPSNKVNYHVDFPISGLDMKTYMAEPNIEGPGYLYDLFAVCNHSGRMASGHYIAYAKRSDGKDEWFTFDDTQVYPMKKEQVVVNIIM